MRLSKFFLPVLKEDPAEAQIVSHKFMLRAGMIDQTSAGIYIWLPLGLRVLEKIDRIVCEEQDRAGSSKLMMPTLQDADIWRQSGRYDSYGDLMLKIKDRHDRDMLYGPTNEEQITKMVADHVKSYRDLPFMVYQIQHKFRDEIRPRFGVMRGREFYMKDGYSADIDHENAKQAYYKMFASYMRTFARLGVKAIPMRADSGDMGGDLSHEFVMLADTGESEVFLHKDWMDVDPLIEDIDYDKNLEPLFDKWTSIYAATDEIHDPKNCPVPEAEIIQSRGIEIGHVFNFGTKYSEPMGATVTGPDGKEVSVHMGSYGIGVSRLVAAIIEASHDDAGIIWPEQVAPFHVVLVNLNMADENCAKTAADMYQKLQAAGVEVLYDDRDERAGVKLGTADLIGVPWQVVIGPRGLEKGFVELKHRATNKREEISPDVALNKFTAAQKQAA